MGLRERFSRYPSHIWALALGMAAIVCAYCIFWPLTTIYVHLVLGHSMAAAGLVLMFQSAASMVGSIAGGALFDGWGGRRTLLLGAAITALASTMMIFFHTSWLFVVLVSMVGLGDGLIAPAMYAFAASIWPQGGRDAFNVVYVSQNVGVAAGSFAGGFISQFGFTFTFVAASAMALTYLALCVFSYRGAAWTGIGGRRREVAASTQPRPRVARLSLRLAPLLLALGLMLDWTAYVQWQTTTPIYMRALGYPLPLYSMLWTINGGVILLGQPLTNWITARMPQVKHQILLGSAIFVAAYLLLVGDTGYPGFVAGMLLTTFGEMFVWPGVPAATDAMVPTERRGFYQGVLTGGTFVGRMVGPVLGGLLFAVVSRAVLFLIMAAIMLLAFLIYLTHDRRPQTAREQNA